MEERFKTWPKKVDACRNVSKTSRNVPIILGEFNQIWKLNKIFSESPPPPPECELNINSGLLNLLQTDRHGEANTLLSASVANMKMAVCSDAASRNLVDTDRTFQPASQKICKCHGERV
jgi:hypothetical protein